jgi:hypothetical protein
VQLHAHLTEVVGRGEPMASPSGRFTPDTDNVNQAIAVTAWTSDDPWLDPPLVHVVTGCGVPTGMRGPFPLLVKLPEREANH